MESGLCPEDSLPLLHRQLALAVEAQVDRFMIFSLWSSRGRVIDEVSTNSSMMSLNHAEMPFSHRRSYQIPCEDGVIESLSRRAY